MMMLWLQVVLQINLNLPILLNLNSDFVFKEIQAWHPRSRRCNNKPQQTRRRAQEQPRALSRWGECATGRWD
jgi:hypothetical protein